MTTFVRQAGLRRTVMALALLAAFEPLHAESQMEASASAGVAGVSGNSADRAIFGQYNGMREQSAYGLLDFGYTRRDSETGAFTQFLGSNLGLQTRELSFLWKRQGNWKVSAGYDEQIRYDPNSINTGVQGVGTTTPQVSYLNGGPGSGSTLDLKTKRQGLSAAFSKVLSDTMNLEASIRTENKEGSRLWGRGMACPSPTAPGCAPPTNYNAGSAVLLLPEPINSNHTQAEARLSYAGEKLRISGGYYGSFYNNSNGSMTPSVSGPLNSPIGDPLVPGAGLLPLLNQAMGLPPENQSQLIDVGGNYLFSPTTRGTFKLAYGQGTQTQDFGSAGLAGAPAGVSNLGGKVTTTLAQMGISSRPLPKLTLIADLRYDDRDDKTTIAGYNVEGTSTYTNRSMSNTRLGGKLQANYRFNNDYTGTVGLDYLSVDRGVFTPSSAARGVSALREKNDELGYRLELRRRMSESFSGSLQYASSRREGSDWLRPNSGTGVTSVGDTSTFPSGAIFMPSMANRQRDKVKLVAFWEAAEGLSLQFAAEAGKDNFNLPNAQGLQDTNMNLLSVDGTYAVAEGWNLNAYLSWGTQKFNQSKPGGYVMAFDNTNTNFGLGFTGKATEKIDLGGGISYVNDNNAYSQTLEGTAGAGSAALLNATGGLPDILFRRTDFWLYGRYALEKGSSVRLDLRYMRAKFNDWAYGYNGVPYTYSDNSTVTQQQDQSVTYLGVSYVHAFQ